MAGFGGFMVLAAIVSACHGNWGEAVASLFIGLALLGVRADQGEAQYRPHRAYCRQCGGYHLTTEPHV